MAVRDRTELFAPSERERLLAAVAWLCERRGLGEIGVEDLLASADVEGASFEAIFPGGIEECLLAAVSAATGRTAGAMSRLSDAGSSDTEGAIWAITEAVESMAAHPAEVNLAYVIARQSGPRRARASYEAGIQMMVLVLERMAERSGRVPASRSAARAGIGGAEALLRRELLAGRAGELERVVPEFIYSVTVGLLGRPEALRLMALARELIAGDGRSK